MTKVCHMTSAHGAEDVRVFHKECVSLAKAGYEVYLVERGESYEKNGVHIVGVGDLPTSRRKRMTEGANKVYEKARDLDADVYHFHDPELLPYGLKLKRAGKKVIFDSHERYTLQLRDKPYLPKWITMPLSWFYGLYEKHVLHSIDGVVFPCMMEGKDPFDGACRHSAIISNAALLSEFYDHYDPEAEKNKNQVCYIGSLTRARGVSQAMWAAEKANVTLALGGIFDSKAFEEQVRSDPAFSCVDYRGFLNREEVRKLAAESMIGISALLDEGQYLRTDNLSVKVYEYLSMGLPVILTRGLYNNKVVDQWKFGICVDPMDTDEYASAIRFLLDHPGEARQMGENGRRAIKEEFNWGVEEKKLLALYKDIIEENER